MQGRGDPLSQLRLARLHGTPGGPDRLALRATEQWQLAEKSVKGSMDRPDLTLHA